MNGLMDLLGKKFFSRGSGDTGRPEVRRILLVHNEQDQCESLTDFLEEEGYRVSRTRQGRKAVSMVLNGGVDAVIIKGKLLDLSGYEVASIVRRLDPEIRVILTVGDESELYGGEREQVDFFPCLLEPFQPRQILRALEGGAQK
ncbi:MAG: response regulator [Candidatus Tectomicrobia bacterium]|uniref:Response regulator n=1 Tax=Tectimicrobiota bacterium TaxID=2528274 RepID=A0A932GNY7_UNCTE|nr:response regulator [Candidatus Tectomicrobia bacterium]